MRGSVVGRRRLLAWSRGLELPPGTEGPALPCPCPTPAYRGAPVSHLGVRRVPTPHPGARGAPVFEAWAPGHRCLPMGSSGGDRRPEDKARTLHDVERTSPCPSRTGVAARGQLGARDPGSHPARPMCRHPEPHTGQGPWSRVAGCSLEPRPGCLAAHSAFPADRPWCGGSWVAFTGTALAVFSFPPGQKR